MVNLELRCTIFRGKTEDIEGTRSLAGGSGRGLPGKGVAAIGLTAIGVTVIRLTARGVTTAGVTATKQLQQSSL